jgi:hypothetical protein
MPDSPLGWDEALPANAGVVALGPIQVRETKLQFSSRMEKEHAVIAASGVGGEHKAGSAFAFYQDETPVLRPDEVTNLDVNDNGRLWINSTNNLLYFWATTIPVRVRTDTYAKLTYTNAATNKQDGGAAVATTWTIRPLNTSDLIEYTVVTLNATTYKFTLAAGTYRVRIRGAFCAVDGCRNRLYNYTTAAVVLKGDVGWSSSTISNNGNVAFANVWSEVVGQFVLSDSSELGVQYWVETAKSAGGLGWGGDTVDGYNTFLTVEIWKVADA